MERVRVKFPHRGLLRIECPDLFFHPGGRLSRQFSECVLRVHGVVRVTVHGESGGRATPCAEVHYRGLSRGRSVARCISKALSAEVPWTGPPDRSLEARGDAVADYFRYGSVVTTWNVTRAEPGRLLAEHRSLRRGRRLCRVVENHLANQDGVGACRVRPRRGQVEITYDHERLSGGQILEILDRALGSAAFTTPDTESKFNLAVCSAALPLSVASQFLLPALTPVSTALLVVAGVPTFFAAWKVVFRERRLGVDVLDAIVIAGCLATSSIFPGAVLCWCLSFSRFAVARTRGKSTNALLGHFDRLPRHARLLRGGVEVEVQADLVGVGDVIVVDAGETVPVDGTVLEGLALIDQHVLTGESTPVEKGRGDRVFSASIVLSGRAEVQVETSGRDTVSARIVQILAESAGYTLHSQLKGERLADQAVLPTLALGGLGYAFRGVGGALAVLNSDLGTGLRMSAPLALLSSLALCASRGVLIKDGRALEALHDVDTFLFDKTGTLTHDRLEVGGSFTYGSLSTDDILRLAAISEQRFHHPIARAIVLKAEELGFPLPTTDGGDYRVGLGIAVEVSGKTVKVGSARFMAAEGITLGADVLQDMESVHGVGGTMILVAVDGRLEGAIELRALVRNEAAGVIEGLRRRGIRHIAIISGDHESPTSYLAEGLGVDRYFAQVLPVMKADYVTALQREGRKVCFVGDGINDAIALKHADVSVSVKGASHVATDSAQVVLIEGDLSRLLEILDVARDLDRNVRRSWHMVLVPNLLCVVGAFTLGFGMMASVVTNNIAALAALVNGVWPMRNINKPPRTRHARARPLVAPATSGFRAQGQGGPSPPAGK